MVNCFKDYRRYVHILNHILHLASFRSLKLSPKQQYILPVLLSQYYVCWCSGDFNPLRPRQNGRHFPDDIFKWIFLNENVWISNKISLKFVPTGPINNIPALVQIMAWLRSGEKPLSEPMTDSLLTHICVTRPQWVKSRSISRHGIDPQRWNILSPSLEESRYWHETQTLYAIYHVCFCVYSVL